MLTLYRISHSTNVERVALALAHKKLAAESIVVPDDDRARVRRVSGQDLVPVLVDGDRVVVDSMTIVRYLEDQYPDAPRLYPADPARRAECDLFIEWFNGVYKHAPNAIEAELERPEGERDMRLVGALGARLQAHLGLFERLLSGRDYLLADKLSAADLAAFPFVKYATRDASVTGHLFHEILARYQKPGSSHPRVVGWIDRIDRLPRA